MRSVLPPIPKRFADFVDSREDGRNVGENIFEDLRTLPRHWSGDMDGVCEIVVRFPESIVIFR